MRKIIRVTAAATALLLAGCSSNAAHAPSAPRTGASATGGESLSGELLALADLPAGWATSSAAVVPDGTSSCAALNGEAWQVFPTHAAAEFQESAAGPFVLETLVAGSSTRIATSWADSRAAVSQCRSITMTSAAGATKVTLAPMAFPVYGDGDFALALTISSPKTRLSGEIALAEKDTQLVQIIAVGPDGVPASLLEQAVGAAVAKMK